MNTSPHVHPLSQNEIEVYQAATEVITQRFRQGRHHVGAAVRGASGRIYTAVHLQGVIGEPAVCAEKIAIGQAMTAGESGILACAAVRHPKPREENGQLFVLPPCGSCRELLSDYGGGDVRVVLELDGQLGWVRSGDLIPLRRWTRGAAEPA